MMGSARYFSVSTAEALHAACAPTTRGLMSWPEARLTSTKVFGGEMRYLKVPYMDGEEVRFPRLQVLHRLVVRPLRMPSAALAFSRGEPSGHFNCP